jgi:hypothetical protein
MPDSETIPVSEQDVRYAVRQDQEIETLRLALILASQGKWKRVYELVPELVEWEKTIPIS